VSTGETNKKGLLVRRLPEVRSKKGAIFYLTKIILFLKMIFFLLTGLI
jgi:uncharacterized membrane protein